MAGLGCGGRQSPLTAGQPRLSGLARTAVRMKGFDMTAPQAHREDFSEVIAPFLAAWRRLAFKYCGDHHLAEDVVQEALLRLHRHWHRIEVETLDAYARTVLRRLVIDEGRRTARRREYLTNEIPERRFFDSMPATEAWSSQLSVLTSRPRSVLWCRFGADLSVAETAEKLGISQGTVKSMTSRSLTLLRERSHASSCRADQ